MGEDESSRVRRRSKSPSREDRHKKQSSKDKHKRRERSEEADERRSKHRRSKHDEFRDERKMNEKDRKDKDKSRKARPEGLEIVDDDDDGDVWVEKDLDATHAIANIPTALSLPLRSNPNNPPPKAELPHQTAAASTEADRPAWMLDPTEPTSITVPAERNVVPHSRTEDLGGLSGSADFFSDLGTEKKRKDPNDNKPDPNKVVIHRNELNEQLKQGKTVDEYAATERKVAPGGPGHQWRMMKLRRLYEAAEESQRSVEEVAMERYGNMEEFQEALQERAVLDEREQRRNSRRGGGSGTDNSAPGSTGMRTPDATGARRFVFTNTAGEGPGSSRPSSRAGFRRPGEDSNVGTPVGRVEELKRTLSSSSNGAGAATQGAGRSIPRHFDSKPQTPIPSVFAPRAPTSTQPASAPVAEAKPDPTSSTAVMSIGELNKMQAKVLRAKLLDDPEAENLEAEYDVERYRFETAGGGDNGNGLWAGSESGVQGQMGRETVEGGVQIQMLPTLDGQGRLYDVGLGQDGDEGRVLPGNRRKKPEKFETRDKTGQLLRVNADDDTQTLGDLVRQERFGGGAADQKNLDYEMATAIAKDGKYSDTHDYIDENAERLARKKMKTDAMKRQFAINDYAKTKKALDTCQFCYQEEAPPQTAIVALGSRAYLCCTQTEELVPGHCLIVPIQHHLSTLELEDDDWDEIKNFMKCLMRMYAQENRGVIFFETCLSFRQQRHTYIEAIPLPANEYNDAPAYFKEAILSSETEWSQHKKLIDFSARPGGFRRAMVSNLPYFMVQFDYRGERGYGHVIEGLGDAPGKGVGENDDGALDEGDNGGGAFPPYFAAEIIGNMLGVEPRKWRRPQKIDTALNAHRARELGTKFQPFDWTLSLREN